MCLSASQCQCHHLRRVVDKESAVSWRAKTNFMGPGSMESGVGGAGSRSTKDEREAALLLGQKGSGLDIFIVLKSRTK